MTPVQVRLRELRQARGLTQEALSERANVPQPTISQLETGKQQRADFAVLERLARALGVQIGDLLVLEPRKGRPKA